VLAMPRAKAHFQLQQGDPNDHQEAQPRPTSVHLDRNDQRSQQALTEWRNASATPMSGSCFFNQKRTMSIHARITNFFFDAARQLIFASDDRGCVHALDRELRPVQSSAASIHSVHLMGFAQDEAHLYSRDVAGNLIRWSKNELQPLDFFVTEHFASVEAQAQTLAAPSTSNAVIVIGDEVQVANACGSISVFDRRTMALKRVLQLNEPAFPESIGLGPDGHLHIITDTLGNIYTYDPDTDILSTRHHGSGYNTHCVVHDRKHNRLLATSDMTGGIFGMTMDFVACMEVRISNDDIERIVISQDGELIYVACFDHFIHVLNNSTQPEEIACIGPFKMQIIHMREVDAHVLGVLLESGELYLVDRRTGQILAEMGGTTALWEITVQGNTVIGACENGSIERFEISSTGGALSFERRPGCPDLSRGRIRRTAAAGGRLFVVTALGKLMALAEDHRVLWEHEEPGIFRDVAIASDGVTGVAVNEFGIVMRFDCAAGRILSRYKNTKPVYCVEYDSRGRIVFGERGLFSIMDGGGTSRLAFLDPDTMTIAGEIQLNGNHKRLRNLPDGRLLLNGNGTVGISVIDVERLEVVANFLDWVSNTVEDSLVYDGKVYACTYGYQILSYDLESGQTLDVQYIAEGYPKSLQTYVNADGVPFLIAGGRNCLMAFRLDRGSPELVCTRYLFDALDRWHAGGSGSRTSPDAALRGPQGIFSQTVRQASPVHHAEMVEV
jgi:hypothetical protein